MLKKIILLCLFLAGLAYAENMTTEINKNINWNSYAKMNMDHDKKMITKPILLFVGASTCTYCIQEINEMRNTESLVKLLNDKFYVVHVNQDLEELPINLTVNLTPTMHILNPNTLKIMTPDSIEGAVPMKALEEYLLKIDSAYEYYLKTKKGNK